VAAAGRGGREWWRVVKAKEKERDWSKRPTRSERARERERERERERKREREKERNREKGRDY